MLEIKNFTCCFLLTFALLLQPPSKAYAMLTCSAEPKISSASVPLYTFEDPKNIGSTERFEDLIYLRNINLKKSNLKFARHILSVLTSGPDTFKLKNTFSSINMVSVDDPSGKLLGYTYEKYFKMSCSGF